MSAVRSTPFRTTVGANRRLEMLGSALLCAVYPHAHVTSLDRRCTDQPARKRGRGSRLDLLSRSLGIQTKLFSQIVMSTPGAQHCTAREVDPSAFPGPATMFVLRCTSRVASRTRALLLQPRPALQPASVFYDHSAALRRKPLVNRFLKTKLK